MQVKGRPVKAKVWQQHQETQQLETWAHLRCTDSGKVCGGLITPHFKFFLDVEEDKGQLDFYHRKAQHPHSARITTAWLGSKRVSTRLACQQSTPVWRLFKFRYWFWSNIRFHKSNIIFRERSGYFSKILPTHILRVLQQLQWVLDQPASSPHLSTYWK